MAFTITLVSGNVFNEAGDTISLPKLNQMFSEGYGVLDSGVVETDNIGNNQVTAGKLASTLDLSTNTITLPSSVNLGVAFKTGAALADLETPAFKGQIGIANDGRVYIAKDTGSNADFLFAGVLARTVISAAPDFIGQVAVVSGVMYFAKGTSDENDWVGPRSDYIQFDGQGDDPPDGFASNVTLYAKGTGDAVELYYKRAAGDPIQLTGAEDIITLAPNWDSGWTQVDADSDYDLSDATGDNFSNSTNKGDTGEGATNATGVLSSVVSPTDDDPGFRIIKILIKQCQKNDFYVLGQGLNQSTGTGWGFNIYQKNDALRLRTHVNGVLNLDETPTELDWTQDTLGSAVDEALLRIKIWR